MATTNWQITDIAESQAQKATTNNTANQEIENACTGLLAKTVTTANITLTDAEHNGNFYIRCTGAMTGARDVIVKTRRHVFALENACTGGHNITIKTADGTGVAIANGQTRQVFVDGTNVVPLHVG